MGACTATIDPDGYSSIDGSNGSVMIRCKISPSASYAAGGDTIAASILGLGLITKLDLNASDGGTGTTTSYIPAPVYDSSGVNVTNIQVFVSGGASAAMVEASGDLHALVFDAIAWGT